MTDRRMEAPSNPGRAAAPPSTDLDVHVLAY